MKEDQGEGWAGLLSCVTVLVPQAGCQGGHRGWMGWENTGRFGVVWWDDVDNVAVNGGWYTFTATAFIMWARWNMLVK